MKLATIITIRILERPQMLKITCSGELRNQDSNPDSLALEPSPLHCPAHLLSHSLVFMRRKMNHKNYWAICPRSCNCNTTQIAAPLLTLLTAASPITWSIHTHRALCCSSAHGPSQPSTKQSTLSGKSPKQNQRQSGGKTKLRCLTLCNYITWIYFSRSCYSSKQRSHCRFGASQHSTLTWLSLKCNPAHSKAVGFQI